MDSDDRKSMIKSIVKALKLDEKSSRFPKPEVLSSLFSLADNEGAGIQETLENAYPYLSNHLDAILDVDTRYATDWSTIKQSIKADLSNYLYKKTKRSPMILPVIMEV